MDATPAHDRLGPGAPPDVAHSPSTGPLPIWTFTEGVTGPVSRTLLDCNVNRRVRKWSTAPAKLFRRQDRRSKQPASLGTASTACSPASPLDQTQDLMDALASVTTQADETVIQEMHLSMSEAAIFVHQDLETARQSIWAQMLNLYNVDCVVGPQKSTGQFFCFNGLTLQVEQQDLTTVHGVDAIVHLASTQLTLRGGVMTAIAAVVGPAFQSTCLQTLAGVGGKLEWGEAAISTFPPLCGSQLNCQHVIHASLPSCSGDDVQDEDIMQCMICSVLAVAEKAGVTSLAMPLLGCGLAGWPIPLAAKAIIQEVMDMAVTGSITTNVKKVVFADLSTESVAALRAELARQIPRYIMSLKGTEGACSRAAQWLFQVVKDRKQKLQLPSFSKLPKEQQQTVLHTPHMQHLMRSVSSDGVLALEGDKELVSKVELLVEDLVAAIKPPYVLDCQVGSFPSCWEPQQSNTELFEVDVTSSEVAELVQILREQLQHLAIVKIHRIQNKKLWKLFALHYDNMQERWSHEPELHLANGGLPTLWHGTFATEPHKVYATEQGFTFNFARKEGLWGSGTYYSSQPELAMSFEHTVQSRDSAFNTYLAGVKHTKDLRQVLAVDVLTGNAKEMQADASMRNAPLVEDESVGKCLGISELRYDSVKATHPTSKTPIYITYNSGHGYPKYLITYHR